MAMILFGFAALLLMLKADEVDDMGIEWSSAGIISGKHCVQWHESADPDTWDDNKDEQ